MPGCFLPVQIFSKLLLLSNRKDIINFFKAVCGTTIPLTVITDCTKLPPVSVEIVILDVTLIVGKAASVYRTIELCSDKFICLLPFDSPFDLRSYVDKTFKHILFYPISIERFRRSLLDLQAHLQFQLKLETSSLSEFEHIPDSISGYFRGNSTLMKSVRRDIISAGMSKEPVLLIGETGTGKDTAAELIHNLSDRKEKKMVTCRLATVVESLAESTFFGHVKGSFTNADSERIGLLETANGSTVFFDELGLSTLGVQAVLFTVIDTGNFTKVGSQTEQHVDVRLIFATNEDLECMIREGRFRPEFFFRINDNIIKLPPLRERKEDIWDIVDNFIIKDDYMITEDALGLLENYSWPGNIWELHKCLKRAMKSSEDHIIRVDNINFGPINILR